MKPAPVVPLDYNSQEGPSLNTLRERMNQIRRGSSEELPLNFFGDAVAFVIGVGLIMSMVTIILTRFHWIA
jgi:pilus assembly protein TadC